jgi:hypothetical protein
VDGEATPQPRPRLRDRLRTAYRWVVTPEEPPEHESDEQRRLRRLRGAIALGIVAVSVCSAGAVWRASVHEEAAAHHEARFRQDLVLFQQRVQAAEDGVFEELLRFGAYEEHEWRSRQLARDARTARRMGHPTLASQLAGVGLREARVSDAQWVSFANGLPEIGGVPAYDPREAFDTGTAAQPVGDLRPGELRHEAADSRRHAVRMTLSAALFIAALVFLTLAEVPLMRRPAPEAPTPTSPGAVTRLLLLAGAGTTLAAIVIFLTIPWR